MVKYVKASPDEFGFWSDEDIDAFVNEKKSTRDKFYAESPAKIALVKALLSVDKDEFNRKGEAYLQIPFYVGMHNEKLPYKDYFYPLGLHLTTMLWGEPTLYLCDYENNAALSKFRNLEYTDDGKVYSTDDGKAFIEFCEKVEDKNGWFSSIGDVVKNIQETSGLSNEQMAKKFYWDGEHGCVFYLRLFCKDFDDTNYDDKYLNLYKGVYYFGESYMPEQLKATNLYDALIEAYELQSILDKVQKPQKTTDNKHQDLESLLQSFVTDNYQKTGRIDKRLPTSIEKYDDDLVFEFEGQFDKGVAKAFVDSFLTEHNLSPKKVQILPLFDEDPYNDTEIGLAVSCRFQ